MTLFDAIIWLLLIFAADMAAVFVRDWWKVRGKPKIKTCDKCDEPVKIYQTRDKEYWLCATCRKAYYETKRMEKRALAQALKEKEEAQKANE